LKNYVPLERKQLGSYWLELAIFTFPTSLTFLTFLTFVAMAGNPALVLLMSVIDDAALTVNY